MRHTRFVSSLRSALARVGRRSSLSIPGARDAGAKITIVNNDGPGEGFNDPTPVAPVGGNPERRADSNG